MLLYSCIVTWKVRSMNQGKLEVLKQEMATVNINILGISKLKWTRMDEFNSGDHYIYYYGQESLRRNGIAIIVNKRIPNAELECNLKNDRMISSHFQGKSFNIAVIQVYVPTSNAEKLKFNGSMKTYKTPRTNTQKRCPFHHRGLECKSRKSRDNLENRQICPWSTKQNRSKVNRVLRIKCTGHSKHLLPTTQEMTLHMNIT